MVDQAGDGALRDGGRGRERDRLVDVALDLGRLVDVLCGQQVEHEPRRPDLLATPIDAGQRLEGDRGVGVPGLVDGATDRQRWRPRAAVLVEGDDPGVRVLEPLEHQGREERALAGPACRDSSSISESGFVAGRGLDRQSA